MKALLLIAALAATPALAQQPAPVCVKAATIPGFEGWGREGGAALAVGKPATLALVPARSVHFQPRLSKAAAAGTFGGFFPVTVAQAGTYRIALSDKAWMDVVHRGKKLDSSAHEHGVACSGITKIVAFTLPAGRSYLQLSDTKAKRIGVMVVRG